MALTVLDLLCQCAEGRSELLKHGAGLAVVSKRILRVSRFASDRGVRIIHSIAKFSGSSTSVLQEMLQLGVVSKLCLVLQVDCGSKAKEKATEILKMHSRAWKNSPCLPMTVPSSYPAWSKIKRCTEQFTFNFYYFETILIFSCTWYN